MSQLPHLAEPIASSRSINPATGQEIARYPWHTDGEIEARLAAAAKAFAIWRETPIAQRVTVLAQLGAILKRDCGALAESITLEMGKPMARAKGEVLTVPIGHMEGNYFCTPEDLHRLEADERVAFRYCTPAGNITAEANPNGSLSNIAGILNEQRNVLGMMPHPDRSAEALLGSADGWKIFSSLVETLAAK